MGAARVRDRLPKTTTSPGLSGPTTPNSPVSRLGTRSQSEIPPGEAWYTALRLAAMTGLYGLLQNMGAGTLGRDCSSR